METKGLEPSALQTLGTVVPTDNLSEVTATADDVCPSVCPSEPKTEVETTGDGRSESGFAAALLMIERLPLSDSEKSEAVRRLLARDGT
jgi:hypothetical protein